MEPLVVAFCDTAECGNCGVGKKVCTIEFHPRMRAPILILVEVSVAPQSKSLLDSGVTFIPSVVLVAENPAFEFFEDGVCDLLVSRRRFMRSVLRHTFPILGEHECVWLGFLKVALRDSLGIPERIT